MSRPNFRYSPDPDPNLEFIAADVVDRARSHRFPPLRRVFDRILETSIALMPRAVRRRWQGSIGLDATPVPAFAQYVGGKPADAGMDPDAGWYLRTPASKPLWGYEVTVAAVGPDGPDAAGSFPPAIVGMAVHKRGHNLARNTLGVLRSVVERGHPARFLAADRAYLPSNKDDKLQLPARELGYQPVVDDHRNQLGVSDTAHGAILVEGQWNCPAMPREPRR